MTNRFPEWVDLHVSVRGPEEAQPGAAELARLLGPQVARRSDGLSRCVRVVAERQGRAVGVALFERVDRTVIVRAVGCDRTAARRDTILLALVQALELASQAAGATRLVFPPVLGLLRRILPRRGYHLVEAECAGRWFERAFA